MLIQTWASGVLGTNAVVTGVCSYNSPRRKISGVMETKQLGGWNDAQEIVCYPKLSELVELNMEPKRSQDISKNEKMKDSMKSRVYKLLGALTA